MHISTNVQIIDDDENAKENIMSSENPWKAKDIGDKINTTRLWQKDKLEYMREILLTKYRCCEGYRRVLNSTKGYKIRENTSHRDWGGRPGCKNMLGSLHSSILECPPLPHQETRDPIKSRTENNHRSKQSVTEQTQTTTDVKSSHKQVLEEDVFIITDSLGKGIDTKTISVSAKTLRNKCTRDAELYMQKMNIKSKVLAFVVGTNDLSVKCAEDTAEE